MIIIVCSDTFEIVRKSIKFLRNHITMFLFENVLLIRFALRAYVLYLDSDDGQDDILIGEYFTKQLICFNHGLIAWEILFVSSNGVK